MAEGIETTSTDNSPISKPAAPSKKARTKTKPIAKKASLQKKNHNKKKTSGCCQFKNSKISSSYTRKSSSNPSSDTRAKRGKTLL